MLISEWNKICILTLTTKVYKKKRLAMDWNQTASFSHTSKTSSVDMVLESQRNTEKEMRVKFNFFHIYFSAINWKLS